MAGWLTRFQLWPYVRYFFFI